MKGIWLESRRISYRDDLPEPVPQAHEAAVRVRMAGICGTDLQMLRGYYSFSGIPGHEFVGEVVAAPGNGRWIGRRVVGDINISCGICPACRAARRSHCEKRAVVGIKNRNGAFAEYLTLPVDNLHAVPDGVADHAAVFTEPLAAALEITAQVPVQPSDAVLVIGAGKLGQLIAQALAATGCDLRVIARYQRQRDMLAARHITVTDERSLPERTMDIVIEATGTTTGINAARRAVRPRGTIVLKSTCAGRANLDLAGLVVDEITIVGSRCGPLEPALSMLERNQVDPTSLIQERCSVTEAPLAYDAAARKGALKVLFEL